MKIIQIVFICWIFNSNFSVVAQNWIIEPVGSYEINLDIPQLGGLSSIKINQAGKHFVSISDKGRYFEGNILRDINGAIIDISIFNDGPLLNSSGQPLAGRNTDSEAFTTTHENGFFISFESNHRIMFHESLDTAGTFLPKHKDFKHFKANKGLEAIAANSSGEIFAIPEEPSEIDANFPIYKLKDNNWSVLARFPPSGSFQVTDAVFLPDDNMLLLERDYDWGVGFKMQLRILNIQNDTITGQNVLFSLDSGLHNHEGLSIWQDDSNKFFLTSISDNNFLPFVASEIREFRLKKYDGDN